MIRRIAEIIITIAVLAGIGAMGLERCETTAHCLGVQRK